MNKKTVFFVPHQDDELLVGGAALYVMANSSGWDTYVVYLTNGDARGTWEAQIRISDSIKALKVLGVPITNVYFLGYGNRWGGTHIYNCADDELVRSACGMQETYGTDAVQEYCYMRHARHHAYTRGNMKTDIMDVLSQLMPEVIFAVDMDSHADHRAASLLLEECLADKMRGDGSYRPVVFKKFAYGGIWYGEADYWDAVGLPEREAAPLGNPYFDWDERVRFEVPEECRTRLLCDNILYKAAQCYRTQGVWRRAASFINGDICFWVRETNNHALDARISVSSGNAGFLNDFKIIDSGDIHSKDLGASLKMWQPGDDDEEKWITIDLKGRRRIKQVVLYECSKRGSGIQEIELAFNDTRIRTAVVPQRKNVIGLSGDNEIGAMTVRITRFHGTAIGISEIELLDDERSIDEVDIPLKRYGGEQAALRRSYWGAMVERRVLGTRQYWEENVAIPFWDLSSLAPELRERPYLYPYVLVKMMMRRLLNKFVQKTMHGGIK